MNLKKKNDGFSLVEVLVAVAILAILSLPLLGYFIMSANQTARGKYLQQGQRAASDILEELRSYQSYDQIQQATVLSGSAWSVDVPESGNILKLTKKASVDGVGLIGKVTLDYNYDSTGSAMTYNQFQVPSMNQLYSDTSLVAVEDDQWDKAVNHFYYQNIATDTKSQIESQLTRLATLDITKSTEDPLITLVKVSYTYSYKGVTYQCNPLINSQIATADLQEIYWLYELHRSDVTEESVKVNFNGFLSTEVDGLKIFCIAQTPQSGVTKPSGYHITLTGTGSYLQAAYYTNGIPTNVPLSKNDYVEKEQEKRIASVTIDIYKQGETNFTKENRILQIQSAKGGD